MENGEAEGWVEEGGGKGGGEKWTGKEQEERGAGGVQYRGGEEFCRVEVSQGEGAWNRTVQYSAVQCSTVQYSTVQYCR